MKDGYYLSTYLHIDPLANTLKFRIRHDQNMSLWKKEGEQIKLIHYWELERTERLKQYSRSFFTEQDAVCLINNLLHPYGLKINDMVEVWGTPQLQTCEDYHSVLEFPEVSYHSIAHLFSSILSDTDIFEHENIVALSLDGGPDTVIDEKTYQRNFYSGAVFKKGCMVDIFPVVSPGFLWSYLRRRYHLREGSLMALGSASKSALLNYNASYPRLSNSTALYKAESFIKELGDYTEALSSADIGRKINCFDTRFSEEENKISAVVKIVQSKSMEMIERELGRILEQYSLNPEDTYLAMSGGYVLNCPTNSYLMRRFRFKGFLAPPCVNDSGISLGMALYAFYKKMNGNLHFKLSSAFWGNGIREEDVDEVLLKYKDYIREVKAFSLEQAIDDIRRAPIIWCEGRAEIGPRALGHRSILADVNDVKSKELLNQIKQREWWRPVAPIILENKICEWFEDAYSSPYMLHTFYAKESQKKKITSVLHLDGSARVQTINQDSHPLLYKLLAYYDDKHGIPLICNTSLNDKGEPIIDTAEDAIRFALKKSIPCVYLNGVRLYLHNFNCFKFDEKNNREKETAVNDVQVILQKLNPYHVSKEILILLYYRPELRKKFCLTNPEDVRRLEIYAKIAFSKLGVTVIPGI